MVKPWLNIKFIYNLSSVSKQMEKCQSIIHGKIMEKIVFQKNNLKNNDFSSEENELIRLHLENPDIMTEEDIMYQMLTVFVAAEDTHSIMTSFACLCFGMNPQYQQKAFEEIRDVIGKDGIHYVTYEKLLNLKYLEMCIKDVIRLFPIAPYKLRQTFEDTEIDGVIYPPGCAIVLGIFQLHRDPKNWEHPNDFYPDHFLPEIAEKRPNFSFVPFSGGIRNCIGNNYDNNLKYF